MSKVVHLSDVAHARAKGYCQQAGLKMSEWVAVLIDRAVASQVAAAAPRDDGEPEAKPDAPTTEHAAAGARLKPAVALAASEPQEGEGAMPLYAAPPFWASSHANKAGHGDAVPAP